MRYFCTHHFYSFHRCESIFSMSFFLVIIQTWRYVYFSCQHFHQPTRSRGWGGECTFFSSNLMVVMFSDVLHFGFMTGLLQKMGRGRLIPRLFAGFFLVLGVFHLDACHEVTEGTVDILTAALHGWVVGSIHGVHD